jgi:GGDEF domain-containing protein
LSTGRDKDFDGENRPFAADGGAAIEEIAVGLPIGRNSVAELSETYQVRRFLLQDIRRIERELIEADRVDDALWGILAGLRATLGCKHVEVWLLDEEGVLQALLRGNDLMSHQVFLTQDPNDIASLFPSAAELTWVDEDDVVEMHAFRFGAPDGSALLIPLIESGRVVGSVHCACAQDGLLETEADCDLFMDLSLAIPLCLRRAVSSQQASELMLLDEVTHVANAAGLARELSRELERAKRNQKAVSLVVLSFLGLPDTPAVAQRVRFNHWSKSVVKALFDAMRTTDSLNRLERDCFAIVVVDAQVEALPEIAARLQSALLADPEVMPFFGDPTVELQATILTVPPGQLVEADMRALTARLIGAARARPIKGDADSISPAVTAEFSRQVVKPVSSSGLR